MSLYLLLTVMSKWLTIDRKHVVWKGKRRDTTWFSMTDEEWPAVKRGLEKWLDESNFDSEGKQKRTLKECRETSN